MQLCCARNKRRQSASRYHGLANVVSKRARKGFNVKYNPDQHWSASFYSGLDSLQYKDGYDIVNVGRDDQAGFQLDTMATHKLHATLCTKGNEHITTRCDYVNQYKSTLQTTSYNFAATETTAEICAGVVKASVLFNKNAAQHYADIQMLEEKEETKPAFTNNITKQRKPIECARVDGSFDEGPSHLDVQFWWTKRHLETKTKMTLVTTRNSGASYRNRVELQNGCLSLAHANLFIPSTLNGSCVDSGGKINQQKLCENLSSAVNVYISRVNKAPCAGTEIHLYSGAEDVTTQTTNEFVKIFLKGSAAAKRKLKQDHPKEYQEIEQVWDLRKRHMVKDLPTKYVFCLKCCYQKDCVHPACKEGTSDDNILWYPGGPPITFIPLPVPDPDRCYGSKSCKECPDSCTGHYMKIDKLIDSYRKGGKGQSKPPSEVILKELVKSKYVMTDAKSKELSEKVLLPDDEVKMWCEHLKKVHENRKKGAQTRKNKNKAKSKPKSTTPKSKPKNKESCEDLEKCCTCGEEEPDEPTDENVNWICCDCCSSWHHMTCVGATQNDASDYWICSVCDYN